MIVRALDSITRVVGVDINDEMLRQAQQRCPTHPQVSFLKRRIEEPLPFHEEFDKAFSSFALRGLEDEDKDGVIANAYQAWKRGATF